MFVEYFLLGFMALVSAVTAALPAMPDEVGAAGGILLGFGILDQAMPLSEMVAGMGLLIAWQLIAAPWAIVIYLYRLIPGKAS